MLAKACDLIMVNAFQLVSDPCTSLQIQVKQIQDQIIS